MSLCVFVSLFLCLFVCAHVDCAMVVIVVICSFSYSSWKFVVDVRLEVCGRCEAQDREINKGKP